MVPILDAIVGATRVVTRVGIVDAILGASPGCTCSSTRRRPAAPAWPEGALQERCDVSGYLSIPMQLPEQHEEHAGPVAHDIRARRLAVVDPFQKVAPRILRKMLHQPKQ